MLPKQINKENSYQVNDKKDQKKRKRFHTSVLPIRLSGNEPEVERSEKTRRLKCLLHLHHPIHDSPVSWEGTHIWIIAWGARRFKT